MAISAQLAHSGDQEVRSGSLGWLQRQSWVLWHLCDLCTETFTWCTWGSQLWACDIIEGYLKFLKSVLSLPPQRKKSCVQHNEISCEIFSAIGKFPQTGKIQCLESTTMEIQCGMAQSWDWGVPCPRVDPLARLLWGMGLSLTNGVSTLSKMHSNTVPSWPIMALANFRWRCVSEKYLLCGFYFCVKNSISCCVFLWLFTY